LQSCRPQHNGDKQINGTIFQIEELLLNNENSIIDNSLKYVSNDKSNEFEKIDLNLSLIQGLDRETFI
jgi:hypothetical protein